MCDFQIDLRELNDIGDPHWFQILIEGITKDFPDAFETVTHKLLLKADYRPLVRIIAGKIDQFGIKQAHHSLAV